MVGGGSPDEPEEPEIAGADGVNAEVETPGAGERDRFQPGRARRDVAADDPPAAAIPGPELAEPSLVTIETTR